MDAPLRDHYQTELSARRARLETAAAAHAPAGELTRLLGEVDAALLRLENGTFGLCLTCGDPIEADRLAADPLTCFCLDHLSPREQRALEEDLELARRIQHGFLPLGVRQSHGWEFRTRYVPAGIVGGDYCDVVGIEERAAAWFVVGDISGKGVAASLLMSHLHAIFRSLLSANLELPALALRANRLLCQHTLPASYATSLCGLAHQRGTVELVSAGHCEPILIRGGVPQRIPCGGIPMGLFCETQYQAHAVALAPGDSLLLYTDGVVEASNPEGEEFGIERLLALCAGAHNMDLVTAIAAQVEAFRRGAPPSDDLSLMHVLRLDQ